MEADLHRYYRLDVVDVWRGTITFRKLGVLVRGLPPESATQRRGLAARGWSLTDYLLADLWALQARRMGGEKAPAQHPWRESDHAARSAPAAGARRSKLVAAQSRNRRVAGR